MAKPVCIFDAYGTLFDVNAAARKLAQEPAWAPILAAHWVQLSATWRQKQLSYSWLRTITDTRVDFWQITQDGLDFALEQVGLADNVALRARLLELYWQLSAFDDAQAMLETLKQQDFRTGILSNGSPEMLDGAVSHAKLGEVLDAVLSVEQAGIFKPDARVYDLVGAHFDCATDDVLFVSSNGWDIAAAAGYGFHTAWVNRIGEPVDRLANTPEFSVKDLTSIVEIAAAL